MLVSQSRSIGDNAVTLTPLASGGQWGQAVWGQFTWGGALGGSTVIRTLFPRPTMRSHWVGIKLTLNQAFTSFSLAGVNMWFNYVSSKVR